MKKSEINNNKKLNISEFKKPLIINKPLARLFKLTMSNKYIFNIVMKKKIELESIIINAILIILCLWLFILTYTIIN